MSRELYFQAKYLPVLDQFTAAPTDFRSYLQCVIVEPHETQGCYLIGSNGHIMVIIHDVLAYAREPTLVSYSQQMVSTCKKKRNKYELPLGYLQLTGHSLLLREDSGSPPTFGAGIDSRTLLAGYSPPDESEKIINWREPIRRAVDVQVGEMAGGKGQVTLSSALQKKIVEATKLLGIPKNGVIYHVRTDRFATVVRWPGSPEVIGLVMPMISTDGMPAHPEWLNLEAVQQVRTA